MQPKIILPINIKNKIQFIVDNCSMEVSGLGTVVFDKEANAYRVTDVILLEQEVGSAHTDLDDKAVAKACYDMRNSEGELAFWWHSHVNMDTFWSGTDHETMDSIGKNGLCVAIVFNKKESMRGAIVMSADNFPTVKLDNVDIEVEYEYDFNTEELLKEIKEKVKPKVYTAPNGYNSSSSHHFWKKDEHEPVRYSRQAESLEEWKKKTQEEETKREMDLLEKSGRYTANQMSFFKKEWSELPADQQRYYYDFEDFCEQLEWEYKTIMGDEILGADLESRN
jgi:hypothetical protein